MAGPQHSPVRALTAAVGVLVALASTSFASAQEYKATLAGILAPTHLLTRAYAMMADRTAALTNGAVKITVVHSSQLGGIKESVEAVIAGNLEMAQINNAALGPLDTRALVFDLPFIFRDNEHMKKVVRGEIGKKIYDAFAAKTGMMIIMAGLPDGPRSVFNKVRPIRTPKDLDGLKIRVMESPIMIDTFKALGAIPSPMPFPEVYMAAKQGVIDGAETPPAGLSAFKAWEIAKYYSYTNHFALPAAAGVNVEWFESLPPAYREAILKAADEATAWYDGEYDRDEKRVLEIAKKEGMEVNSVEDLKQFRDAVKAVYAKYEERIGGPEVIRQIAAVQ